jgi:threonine dehydrogenase-like Zn-dependent dehydrogenase
MFCAKRSTDAKISARFQASVSMAGPIPMGSAINCGLTFHMAQAPVQRYLPQLLDRIEKGEIDPSFVIAHRATLEEGPELYKTFRDKKDGCIKVVLKPGMAQAPQRQRQEPAHA